MCAVSFIGDDFAKRFPQQYPNIDPFRIEPLTQGERPFPLQQYLGAPVSRDEYDKLRNEVADLKKLLMAAKEYDKNTGQPDCEMEDKVSLIKAVAKMVGVNMDEVFK